MTLYPGPLSYHMVQASLKRYFLTGLLVMIPIWGTILILKTLFVSLDGILGDAAARLVTPGYYVPGLGTSSNQIYKNWFNEINFGNYAWGINRSSTNPNLLS